MFLKNIQDQAAAVQYFCIFRLLVVILDLGRAQFIVKKDKFNTEFRGLVDQLFGLTFTDKGCRVDPGYGLGDPPHDFRTGCVRQEFQFIEMLLDHCCGHPRLNDPYQQRFFLLDRFPLDHPSSGFIFTGSGLPIIVSANRKIMAASRNSFQSDLPCRVSEKVAANLSWIVSQRV